jgi:hypothetical protein
MGSIITLFTKSGGPLTKRISLAADGSIKSDASTCLMARGTARRVPIADVGQFASLIEQLRTDQAIALGALRPDLPDKVQVVTKHKLNGQPQVIARTGRDLSFQKGQAAFALLDYDTKGMPRDVADTIKRLGGCWPALLSVLPGLGAVAHVTRRSTSAGLFRIDTKEKLPGSDGLHIYPEVQDGADVERFLKTCTNAAGWPAWAG